MKIIRKILIILILFVLSIALTSCKGARELDTLGIVISTGFDLEDGLIVITNEVINPAAGASSNSSDIKESTKFVQGKGLTIRDAIAQTALTFDRELYYPHNNLIIIGEGFAKDGIGQYIDLLTRGNEQRERAFLLVSKGGKAYEVMGIDSGISKSPGRYIYEILNREMFNGQTRTLTTNEFLRYYYRKSGGYILGVVSLIEAPDLNSQNPSNTIEVICADGGAVFDVDKLKGYYSGEEMVGFNFLVDNLKSTDIVFEAPEPSKNEQKIIGSKGKYTVLQVFKSKTKRHIKLEEDKLHLYINVILRGDIAESTQPIDLKDRHVIETVEKACEEKVKEMVTMTLNKAQKEFEIDSFGLGELVHRRYPKLWKDIEKDWMEIFKDLPYTINVDVSIADTGFTNTSVNLRKTRDE